MLKPLPPPWDRFVPFIQKIVVWSLFFGVLWFLRPFFLMVFLTFVFGYVMQHLVEKMEGRVSSRKTRVVISFLVLLTALVGLGYTVAPPLAKQVRTFFESELDKYQATLDEKLQWLRGEYEFVSKLLPEDVSTRELVGEVFQRDFLGGPEQHGHGEETHVAGVDPGPIEATDQGNWRSIVREVISLLNSSIAIGSAFLLSLLFSFLIVLDFPNLTKGARALRETRARFFHEEMSESILHFGHTLGQALEAQLLIATLNTAMTAVGLSIMGIPNIAFLSCIVFVCSFIPVAGVFISSVPICLQALADKGAVMMFWVIAFITLVHMIEAYVLNPRIYGAHLRMNPVLVLGILVISHHLFGMWGLVLGVPVTTYVYKHVIIGGNGSAEPGARVAT